MSTVQHNPYKSPTSTRASESQDEHSGWSTRTWSYVAVITGICGAVVYQFITDTPKKSPSGVEMVTAYVEVAALSAFLSLISTVAFLRLRRQHRTPLRRWQSIGLILLALTSSTPAIMAWWHYIFPFLSVVSGIRRP